eukprot:7390247-Prymnesium_polylepis.1
MLQAGCPKFCLIGGCWVCSRGRCGTLERFPAGAGFGELFGTPKPSPDLRLCIGGCWVCSRGRCGTLERFPEGALRLRAGFGELFGTPKPSPDLRLYLAQPEHLRSRALLGFGIAIVLCVAFDKLLGNEHGVAKTALLKMPIAIE